MKRFITNGDFMYIHRNNRYSAKKIFSLLISFIFCASLILNMAPSVFASPTLDGIKDEGQYTETNKFVAVKPASTPELTNGQQANIYYTWDDNYVYLYAQYSQNSALIAGKQQMSLWINSSPSKDSTKKNSSGNVTTLMGGNNGTCLSNSTTDFSIQVYTTGTSAVFATNEKKATAAGTYVSSKSADNKSIMLEVRVPRESGETEFAFGFEATDWSSTFVRYLSTTTVGNGDPSILSTLFKFEFNPPFIRIDGVKDAGKYAEEKKFAAVKPDSTPALTNGQQANIYYAWDDSYVYLYAQYSQNTALIANKQQMVLWINSSPSKDSTKKNSSGNVTTLMGGNNGTCLSNSTTDFSIQVYTTGTSAVFATNEKNTKAAGTYVSSKSADNKSLMLEVRVPRENGETEFAFGFEATDWSSTFVRYLSTTTNANEDPSLLSTLFKFEFNPPFIRIDGVKDADRYTETNKFVAVKPSLTPELTNGQKADIYYSWDEKYVYFYVKYSQNTAIITGQQMSLWINSSPSKDALKVDSLGNRIYVIGTLAGSAMSSTTTDYNITVNSNGASSIFAHINKQAAAIANLVSLKSVDGKSLIVETRVPRESGETEFSYGYESTYYNGTTTVRYLSNCGVTNGDPGYLGRLNKIVITPPTVAIDGIKDKNMYSERHKLTAVKPVNTPELTNGQKADIYYAWDKDYIYLYVKYSQNTEIITGQSMNLWINSSPSKNATKITSYSDSVAVSALSDKTTDYGIKVGYDGASTIYAHNSKQAVAVANKVSLKSEDGKSLIVETRVPRESGETEFSFGYESIFFNGTTTVRYLSSYSVLDGEPLNFNNLYKDYFIKFELNSFFEDNMVLQRETKVKIWGTALTGDIVTAKIAGKENSTTAINGEFEIELENLPVGGPYSLEVNNGKETKTLSNILVGDVWILGGQSNMRWSFNGLSGEQYLNEGNLNNVRLFTQWDNFSTTELTETLNSKWDVCTPNTIRTFSVVGYFFGKKLIEHDPSVPIGLVYTAHGGTNANCWMPKSSTDKLGISFGFGGDGQVPNSGSYNAMINPILKMATKGVVWYQGESQPDDYDKYLTEIISSWRIVFNNNSLPFVVIQLPRYTTSATDGWARVREAQALVAKQMPNVALSVNIDCGEADNIHPSDKKVVGDRAGDAALAKFYNVSGTLTSPSANKATSIAEKVYVKFNDIGNGLKTIDGTGSFEIAGADGVYKSAAATIVNNSTIRVVSSEVSNPKSIRYAWSDFPEVILYNSGDYPAAPFKLDISDITNQNNSITEFVKDENLANIKNKYNEFGFIIKMFDKNNDQIVSDLQKIGTGMRIEYYQSNILESSCQALVYGDVSGDGAINISDLAALKSHLLKSTLLNGAYEKAGDLSKKGKITISDLIAVKKQILGM